MKIAVVFVCTGLSLFPLAARAGEVLFTNGDRLTGTVLELKDGKLTIDSNLAGKIQVPFEDVSTFSSEDPVTIVFEDKSVIVDKVETAEPGSVRTAGTSAIAAQTVPLKTAVKLNPEPVQWKGTAVAGAGFDRGNTRRDSGNAAIDAVRRDEKDRITFGAGYAAEKTRNTETGEDVTTKRNLFGSLQYDLFFRPKWYMYANARGEKDGVADLALRLTTGVGLGYQFYETDTFKLNVESGPTWVSENYTDDTPNNDYLAVRVAWNLDWVMVDGLSFFHNGSAFPSLESRHDQLVITKTGFRYKLWGDFFGESKMLWTWDSTPADGKERQDLSVILGLGYGF